MLTAKFICEDETFPSVIKNKNVEFSIDIKEFSEIDSFWTFINDRYNINISYFFDQIVRNYIIQDVIDNNYVNIIDNIKLRDEIYRLFHGAYILNSGIVFIAD